MFESRVKKKQQKRESKISAVRSFVSGLNSMNAAITDIPGTLVYSQDTQDGLEAAAVELKDARDIYLPLANRIAPVVIGSFALGSIFIIREIIKESQNV